MQTLRSHRRTLTAALAALGLVIQALLPHVHAWQSADHGVALAFASPAHGARLAAAKHDADHDRTTCPTCQALAHGRQLTAPPRSAALAYVPLRLRVSNAAAPSPASIDRSAPAAPRAPPVSA